MVRKSVLDNGIRLVTESIPSAETVSIGFWIEVGSAYESTKNCGYSHFLEHMLFKGAGDLNAFDIAMKMDGVGGVMNAFTTRESTCFYVNVAARHTAMAVDLLAKMFYEPSFDSLELEREKQVILQEIMMYEDAPEEALHDHFMSALWPTHPVGRPIIGSVETIQPITRRDLVSYYKKHFTTDRLIIAAAGKVNHNQLRRSLKKLPARVCTGSPPVQRPMPAPRFSVRCEKKKLEQVHLILSLPGIPRFHPDTFAHALFNAVMGGGMSSRLYQRLRENEGICYSIYSFKTAFMKQGVVNVYSATSMGYLKKVLHSLREELDKLANEGIPDAELLRAKEQIKGNMILGRESVESRMNRLAYLEMYLKRFISIKEVMARIDAVDSVLIQKIINDVFSPGKLAVSTVGPAGHVNNIEKWYS